MSNPNTPRPAQPRTGYFTGINSRRDPVLAKFDVDDLTGDRIDAFENDDAKSSGRGCKA